MGLANGAFANYTFDIESQRHFDLSDAKASPSPKRSQKRCKYTEFLSNDSTFSELIAAEEFAVARRNYPSERPICDN